MKPVSRSLLFLGLAALAACTGGAKAPLYGTIVEPAGPVEAAEILILTPSSDQVVMRAISGSGGKFAVRARLAAGSYIAEVRHPGYRTVRRTFTYPETSSFEIRLVPQLRVEGVVLLPDRSRSPGARILFKQGRDVRTEVQTDAQGVYTVESLDPGEYTIEVYTPDETYSYREKHHLAGKRLHLDIALTDKAKMGAEDAGSTTEVPVDTEPSAPTSN